MLKPKIDKQIDGMLKLALIRRSNCSMANPIVCIMKKNKSVRLTVDYRYVNFYSTADPFRSERRGTRSEPVPNVEEVKLQVGMYQYITVTDAKSGYWQIPVQREEQWLKGFTSHRDLSNLYVAQFGFKNSGITFVSAFEIILSPLKDYKDLYVVDDVAGHSDTRPQHVEHLKRYFYTISKSGLTLNLKKCQFAKSSIRYEVQVVMDCTRPKSKR